MPPLTPGTVVLKRYVVDEFLYDSETGSVYRGHHQYLDGVSVAIKVYAHRADEASRARFERSARLMARIRDPRVVAILDFGVIDETPCIISEFARGETLRELLDREGPLAWPRAVEIVKQILSGLGAVHQASIVHRTLTTENIVIGPTEAVKLVDLAFARPLETDAPPITSRVSKLGAPAYMSPEQMLDTDVTPRSDLYSVGLILYELLTGKLPEGKITLPRLLARANTPAPRVVAPAGRPRIPPALADLVEDALKANPQERPASWSEFLERLEKVSAAPPPSSEPASRPSTAESAARPKYDSASWNALTARSRLRSAKQSKVRIAALQPPAHLLDSGPRIRGVLAARFLPGVLDRPDTPDALAQLMRGKGQHYRVRDVFWFAALQASSDEEARRHMQLLAQGLIARLGPQTRTAQRLVDSSFELPAVSIGGDAPPPQEVLDLLSEVAER